MKKSNKSVVIAIITMVMLVVSIVGVGFLIVKDTDNKADIDTMLTNLQTMQSELLVLHESVSSNKALVDDTQTSLGNVESVLSAELQVIDEQILATNDEITTLITNLYQTTDENTQLTYNDLLESYATITGGMDIVTDNIDNVNTQISNEISYLSASTVENYGGTIQTLNTVQKNLLASNMNFETNVNESFGVVNKSFATMKELDEKGFNNLEDMITKSSASNGKGNTEIINKITDNSEVLNVRLDNDFHTLNSTVESFETTMNTKLETMNSAIETQLGTQTTALEEKLATSQASLEAKIDNTQTYLEGKIDGQTASLEGTLDGQTTSIEGTIDGQTTTLQSNISGVDTKVDTLTTDVGNMNTDLQANQVEILDKVNANATAIGENSSAISDIEGHLATQDALLEQVFQSASEGKSKLATTLSGYGITISADADFNTINESLSTLYSNAYADGVASVGTANVHYEYHQHKDSSGNAINDERTAGNVGGCFTVYYSHPSHTWGDSCYVYTSHTHTSACGPVRCGHLVYTCTKERCGQPGSTPHGGDHNGYCSACGRNTDFTSADHGCRNIRSYSHCTGELNTGSKLVCTKEVATYYAPGCGYRNDDIERAIIEYR